MVFIQPILFSQTLNREKYQLSSGVHLLEQLRYTFIVDLSLRVLNALQENVHVFICELLTCTTHTHTQTLYTQVYVHT